MNADVLLLDATWTLSDNAEIFLSTSYAVTDAAFDSLDMVAASDVPLILFPSGIPGPGPPGGDDPGPLDTKDYDFSGIHEYTNLDYTELRATLGFRCRVNDSVSLYGSVSYYDLDDDEPYYDDPFGELVDPTTDLVSVWDRTGSVTVVGGGLLWNF